MVDPIIVNRKLQKLVGYLAELKELEGVTLEEYLSDFRHRRTAERLIQVIVDAAVDVNTHAVVDAGNPPQLTPLTLFLKQPKSACSPDRLPKSLLPQPANGILSYTIMKPSTTGLSMKAFPRPWSCITSTSGTFHSIS